MSAARSLVTSTGITQTSPFSAPSILQPPQTPGPAAPRLLQVSGSHPAPCQRLGIDGQRLAGRSHRSVPLRHRPRQRGRRQAAKQGNLMVPE